MCPRKCLPEIEWYGLSLTGPVRPDNQDSICLPQPGEPASYGLLCAVADGMGGYTHGALASQMALKALSESLSLDRAFSGPERRLRQSMHNANSRVFVAAQRLAAGRMGTTLTAAYICGNRLYMAHVGDSRLYLVRGTQATCLTRDHTLVGELARMKLISTEKVRTHAQRSILTKAVGLGLFLKPDISRHPLLVDDRLILCSDGAWSVIQDAEFGNIASQATGAEEICRGLVDLALARHTDDNVSVVVVHVRQMSHPSSRSRQPDQSGWRQRVQNLIKKAP